MYYSLNPTPEEHQNLTVNLQLAINSDNVLEFMSKLKQFLSSSTYSDDIKVRTQLENQVFPASTSKSVEQYKSDIQKAYFSDDQWLSRCIEVIIDNLENHNLSVELIAELMDLSARQLRRKIKDQSGITAKNLIKQIKFDAVKTILEKNPETTFSELTDRFGFFKKSYFLAEYEKQFGVRPKLKN